MRGIRRMKDAYVRMIFCCAKSFPSTHDRICCIPVFFSSMTSSVHRGKNFSTYEFLLYKFLLEFVFIFVLVARWIHLVKQQMNI